MARPRVLVVPGIGGNEIMTQTALQFVWQTVWLDYGVIAVGGWRLLHLATDGLSPIIPGLPGMVGGRPLPAFYGVLMSALNAAGYLPYGYHTDFRVQLARGSELISRDLDILNSLGPVTIVCHSRGGHLVRHALAAMTPDERAARVARVICCGCPHYGSWSIPPFLGARDPFERAVALILGVTDLFRPISPFLPSINQVLCSWPAMYELLPAPGAPGVDPATIPPVYNAGLWAGINANVDPRWLAAALLRWQTLPPIPSDVEWLDIYGEGVPTATALRVTSAPQEPSSYEYTGGGDGSVPSAWAVQPGRPRVRLGGCGHQELMQRGDALATIVTYADPAVPLPPAI